MKEELFIRIYLENQNILASNLVRRINLKIK